jgi:hypothetical protein
VEIGLRKLQGVYFIKGILTSCKVCLHLLQAFKLETLYRSVEHASQTKYMPADLLYCKVCNKGFMLDYFRVVTDALGKKWAAVTASETIVPKNVAPQKSPAAQPGRGTAVDKDRFLVSQIHSIVTSDKCTTCKMQFLKMKVTLVLKTQDGKKEIKEKTRAFHCTSCNNWYLHEQTYSLFRKKYNAYSVSIVNPIPIATSPKPVKKVASRAKLIERDIKATSRVSTTSRSQPVNSNFDKTGRFIHSDATKRWKDYYYE